MPTITSSTKPLLIRMEMYVNANCNELINMPNGSAICATIKCLPMQYHVLNTRAPIKANVIIETAIAWQILQSDLHSSWFRNFFRLKMEKMWSSGLYAAKTNTFSTRFMVNWLNWLGLAWLDCFELTRLFVVFLRNELLFTIESLFISRWFPHLIVSLFAVYWLELKCARRVKCAQGLVVVCRDRRNGSLHYSSTVKWISKYKIYD